jgi:hypothetical protein
MAALEHLHYHAKSSSAVLLQATSGGGVAAANGPVLLQPGGVNIEMAGA